MLQNLPYIIIPCLLIIIGGILTIYFKVKENFKSAILHFAAGVVFSVVGVEILPSVVKIHQPIQIIIGFTAGIILMFIVKVFAEKLEKKEKNNTATNYPKAMVTAIAIDVCIDGLLIGVGFAIGAKQGILLSVALGLEFLSLGLSVGASFSYKNISKKIILKTIIGLALLFLVSALIGISTMPYLPENLKEVILSFGVAALLFLVTEELLNEAHEVEDEKIWMTATFFLGFLIFLILSVIS